MPSFALHARLAKSLLEEIASQGHAEGERFLSNRNIRQRWKVNQWSVDRSIALLKKEGIVNARPRSGYRLAPGATLKAMILAQLHAAPPLPEVEPWPLRVRELVRPSRRARRLVVMIDAPRLWLHQSRSPLAAPPAVLSGSGAALWEALSREAAAQGDRLDLLLLPASTHHRGALQSFLDRCRWEGVLFVRRMCYPQAFEAATQWFGQVSLPCVTVFEPAHGSAHPCVNVNHAGLAYEAVATLMRSGMERVMVVDNLKGRSRSREWRLSGALEALVGNAAERSRIFRLSHEAEDALCPGLLEWLETSREVPTGLVVFNNQLFGKIEAEVFKRGWARKVRLFTISNERPLAPSPLNERHSAIAFDYEAIAREAYRRLRDLLEGGCASHSLLHTSLRPVQF